ncbi:MAG: hypothetical protein VX770_02525 [Candidatus Neomarinimicrobiota bacterium]|jgi:hypothetical protein|nr:hypothetical protein [Candidatus Neomarinimicrobiota bacterium]|tara:strand:+ start:973 stop:1254 length:282 start_codon:yes stop_codon:yes gene_type:complete
MSESFSQFIKFTYTILSLKGIPKSKSWIINLHHIVSIEANAENDLKIFLMNNQIISISLGRDMSSEEIMNDILSLSAEGRNYSVYKIDSFERK